MKLNTKNKLMLPAGSALIAAVLAVTAWFLVNTLRMDTPEAPDIYVVSLSMDVYSTLDDLSDAADAIVLGTVKSVGESGVTRGLDGTGGRYPYNLYEIVVTEALKGQVSETINVVRSDPSLLGEVPSMSEYPLTALNVGQTVILYLDSMSADFLPESSLIGTLYVPLGFDNGVFDVTVSGPIGPVGTVNDDAQVHPRGISPSMFAEGSVFTAADVRQAIEPESNEIGPVGSTE